MASRIFVGNLSYGSSDASLKEHFEQLGLEVVSARIIVDRDTGRSRGFGFVELAGDEQAKRAIAELDGKDLDGRMLALREAHDKKPGGGRPSGDFDSRPRGPRGPGRDFGGPPRDRAPGPRDFGGPAPSGDGGGGRFAGRARFDGPPADPFVEGGSKPEGDKGKRRKRKEHDRDRKRDRWDDEY